MQEVIIHVFFMNEKVREWNNRLHLRTIPPKNYQKYLLRTEQSLSEGA